MPLILNVIKGPDRGRRFELPDHEPQQIGRSSESLQLRDHTISRRHAELTPDQGRWIIRDLGSSNGTFVNGVRVTEQRLLQPGDQVRTGNTIFLFGAEVSDQRRQRVRMTGDEMDSHVEAAIPSNADSMIMAVPEPSEAAQFQLRVIYDLLSVIGSTLDRQLLLEKAMDVIFEHFQADRGFVLLHGRSSQRPDPMVIRHRVQPRNQEDGLITVSRTIVQHVLRHGEGVLSSNAMTDHRFASGDSVARYGIRSAMCVPIRFNDQSFGVIHVDSKVANYTYTEDQLRLLTAIGAQVGLALFNIRLHQDRLQKERLAAVGQTVASLSHSIRNIIQGLKGGAEVVELGLRKGAMNVVDNGWQIVARNLERISALTMNMLVFSKNRQPEMVMTNLSKLIDEVIELTNRQFETHKVALITDIDEDMPPVPLDPNGIHQAVLNLLNNALEAVEPETGVVTVTTRYENSPAAVVIQVADNGHGISEERMASLWEPFFSTKGLRGTGLGLVVTRKIVEEHGGHVKVESRVEQGTTFILHIPVSDRAGKMVDTLSDQEGGHAGFDSAVTDALSIEPFRK
ncbi:MAG: FHA domain-containing protein [Phycisphaeraceae bacterium]|nr:FHA domain-containing protein [Phycisphaeraceae bacterium]